MIIAVFIIQPISYFSLPSCNGVNEWIIALVHGGLGGGGVQGFRLKSRDFCQPVQGSPLSRLASMVINPSVVAGLVKHPEI